MSRLVSRVRDAEERLAGIARALQTAYDEAVNEATTAREAARRGLQRALALENAAQELGQPDLIQRLREVGDQLRAAEAAAGTRLTELAALEETIRARLADEIAPRPLPAPASQPSPDPAEPADPPAVATLEPQEQTAPPRAEPTAPPPASPALRQRLEQLEARVGELVRQAARWPKPIARLAVVEHVALARLVALRWPGGEPAGLAAVDATLSQLRAAADRLALGEVAGLNADEAGDWNQQATQARAERQALVQKAKAASAPAPTQGPAEA